MTKAFREAVKDFRHLLNRHYNRESALSFVGDKHQLSREERMILYRGVYDTQSIKRHRSKLIPTAAISGKTITIDGYNVLITVESLLSDKQLVLCDDGFVRDVSAVHGKHRPTKRTVNALTIILSPLSKHKPAEALFFYDSQVSKSGELAALTRTLIKKSELNGDAQAVKQADVATLKLSIIVASSDAVIIEKATKVVDLAGEIARIVAPNKLLKLTEI